MDTQERHLQERTAGKRLIQLDSLRGIAAVCVVFYHFRLAFNISPPQFYLVPIFSGTQAVMLFFVLSGFVLSLPYVDGKRRPYRPYLIRRFWRIYVPFAAAVGVAALGALIFRGYHLPLTPWYYATWQTPVTASLLAKQLVMVPINSLNTAFWSLSVEVQLSIVMPALALATKRLPALALAAAVFVAFGSLSHLQNMGLPSTPFYNFVVFSPLFFLGAILAKYREVLGRSVRALGSGGWLLLAVSLVLYYDRFPVTWRIYPFTSFHGIALMGFGACGIILCALNLPAFAAVLQHRVPEYLGRISYSLYLVHSVVLFAVLDLFYRRIPFSLLTVAVFAGALVLAHLFCTIVEEPADRTGKRLARSFS